MKYENLENIFSVYRNVIVIINVILCNNIYKLKYLRYAHTKINNRKYSKIHKTKQKLSMINRIIL